jgi:hypothetical protein
MDLETLVNTRRALRGIVEAAAHDEAGRTSIRRDFSAAGVDPGAARS